MNLSRVIAVSAILSSLVGCGQAVTAINGSTPNKASAMGSASANPVWGFQLNGSNRAIGTQNLYRGTLRGNLPASVDLRSQCSPIANQGHLGSCTAFAMGKGLREFLEIKGGKRDFTELSPLYFYYKERETMGTVDKDSGATITTGMNVLLNTGIAPEADDPYDITKFAVAPSAQAEADAANFKISQKLQIGSLNDVKASLADGYPVAFGFMVYSSFRNIGSDGVMPMPHLFEGILGGHAVLAVGYDDARQMLTVRNSWGGDWGDHGYFYMPYKFAAGRNVQDLWTAR